MKTDNPVNIQTHRAYKHEHNFLYKSIIELTESIGDTYPGHAKWFFDTFLTGLKIGNRGYIVAEKDNELAGILLFKDDKDEKKISTLFVNPEYRRQGIASKLLGQAVKELGTNCFLTVSVRNMFQLQPLLTKNKFKIIKAVKGEYKPDNIEYYFQYNPSKVPANIREWATLNRRGR